MVFAVTGPRSLIPLFFLAALRREKPEKATVGAILQLMASHGNIVPNFDIVLLPAIPSELGWAGALQCPDRGLTLVIQDLDKNPRMRIDPVELGYLTL